MERRIVFEGTTEKGLPILVRYLEENDVEQMLSYINALSAEQTYIGYQRVQFTWEEENKMVQEALEKIKKGQAIFLVAFSNGTLVGDADLRTSDPKREVVKHVGEFGVSVAKEYRGKGVGKLLVQLILEEAQKNFPHLEIITLGVFGNNDTAIQMYKKFGFVEHGRLPNGYLDKEVPVDQVSMYKRVKD